MFLLDEMTIRLYMFGSLMERHVIDMWKAVNCYMLAQHVLLIQALILETIASSI